MDVVYNHTGEGGPWQGSTDNYNQCTVVSMRGIDNSTYYCLVNGTPACYWETSGCGNNMQCDNSTVRKLILDSLTYWTGTMGVDGFRFDLATVLGRTYNSTNKDWEFSSSAATLTDIASLGTSTNVEMIAESWDCGSNSYQVGNFPSGWAGWNGRYRDTMRNFVNNGNCQASDISYADALYGDSSHFNTSSPSINFIVAHDGFTLADLCSYAGTGNYYNTVRTWPFGPSNGGNSDTNIITTNTETLRRQRIRDFMTLQMFSAGIPMIVYGDEFGRTQNGNNNPYNLDSICTWNNYSMISSDTPQTVSTGTDGSGGTYENMLGTFASTGKNGNFEFFRYVMNLRSSDSTLRQITGAASNYSYYKNTYGESGYNSSGDRCAGVLISGAEKYYMMINMYTDRVNFTWPAADSGKKWIRIIDTAGWAESSCNCWTESGAWTVSGSSYGVNPWSVVVFKQVSE
jgi:glycogen operon protein